MRAASLIGLALMCGAVGFATTSAEARRTVVDEIPNPNDPEGPGIPVVLTLGGYCDLNFDECGPDDGRALGYQVRFGDGDFVDRAWVHGNGILTFGSAIDWAPFVERIENYETVGLLEYERTLVSIGQSNDLDFSAPTSGGFNQSATLSILAGGVIAAQWYTCYAPGDFCFENPHSLTLTPTEGGYDAFFDFSRGAPYADDRGFVIDGQLTSIGDARFFVPAEFRGLVAPIVPEPASWAMMIAGFGLVGGALRRRAGTPAAA